APAAHGINFFLHMGAAWLVYILSCRLGLTKIAAYVAALVFAVHPMHIESVAWVSERKDLLYTIFYLGAILFYCEYLDKKKGITYLFSLLCALLSILSKPMALSLPLILFLIDYMKVRRFSWASVLDKLPFFIIIEPLACITYLLNSRSIEVISSAGMMLWVWCGAFYVNTFFWPRHLLPVYGLSTMGAGMMLVLYLFLPLAGSAAVWFSGNQLMRRWLGFAILFYFFSTFFVWRFDAQDLNLVADRYMYLPSFGFCGLIGVIVDRWFQMPRSMARQCLLGIVIAAGLMMVFKSNQQVKVWDNGFRFWSYILKARPGADFALKGRIRAALKIDPLFDSGADEDIRRSVDQRYWKNIAKKPDADMLMAGKIFYLRHLWALRDLKQLSRAKGSKKDFYYFSAVAHEHLNQKRNLITGRVWAEYAQAIRLDNKDPLLYYGRGIAALKMKKDQSALQDALKAIRLDPSEPAYYDFAVFCAVRLGAYPMARDLLDVEAGFLPDKASVKIDRVKIDRLCVKTQ
ncbi:MAG: hypothetical protein WCI27_04260, partial [Candidatus Omnitrophota bacterium]